MPLLQVVSGCTIRAKIVNPQCRNEHMLHIAFPYISKNNKNYTETITGAMFIVKRGKQTNGINSTSYYCLYMRDMLTLNEFNTLYCASLTDTSC
jgi:hypothetical protein